MYIMSAMTLCDYGRSVSLMYRALSRFAPELSAL